MKKFALILALAAVGCASAAITIPTSKTELDAGLNNQKAAAQKAIADKLNAQVLQLETTITEYKPKVLFAEAVETSHTSILIGDLAKLLKQNGVDIGQRRLFDWLRENGYLIKSGSSKNMPTQKAIELELFEVKERTINNPDGTIRITKTPKVTGKGQTYFINKFLGDEKEDKK
jgi:anti-repressor protein